MKNKLYYVLMFLILSFSCVSSVFALEFNIGSVVENNAIAKGNKGSIKINLKSDEQIKECVFSLSSDSNIVYDSVKNVNTWQVSSNSADGFTITNKADTIIAPTNGENIAELKYVVNGDGKVTIKTSKCVSVSGEEGTYSDVEVSFTATEPVDDTTLSSLNVIGGQISPSFSSSNYGSYNVTLSSATFGLSMTASKPEYQDKIVVKDVSGNVIEDPTLITFSDPTGQMQMPLSIIVNGASTYSLYVKYVQKDLDNSLESITINGEKLTLTAGKYEYKYTVKKDVSQVKIEAVLKDAENFKFGDNSNAPGTFNINKTVNAVIEVEPKSAGTGAAKVTYLIEIVKEGQKEEDNPPVSNDKGNGSGSSEEKVPGNPQTGGMSIYLMVLIMMASLIGSIVLYQKNLTNYK